MCARNTIFCNMLKKTTKILIMHVDNNAGGPEPKKAKLATGSTGYVAAENVSGRFQYCTFHYVQKLVQINNSFGTCKRLAQNVVLMRTTYKYGRGTYTVLTMYPTML